MTTLRKRIDEAAFWEGLVCLACEATHHPEDIEDGGSNPVCPSCDQPALISALRLSQFLTAVEADED